MLSISTGHSSGYLTDQVGAGMESYYTGTAGVGEPPGVWFGKAADTLGLAGEVDADVMHALYSSFLDPRDPAFADPDTRHESAVLGRAPKRFRTVDEVLAARIEAYSTEYADTPTPEQVQAWRREAERDTPKAVGFYDLTFSPDKSVTVLHTAFVRAGHEAREAGRLEQAGRWEWAAAQIEDAVMAAGAAGLEYVQDKATFTRAGRHGGKGATGRWDDGHGLTVARFLQHTSRDLDPQLHVHQATLNKVPGTDGKWRALDGKSVYAARPGAAAVSERELEVELSRRLGISWELREDGVGRRVVGVDTELEALFSSRREAITADAERRFAEFEAAIGRPAKGIERTRIMQQATLATRRAKTHDGESAAEQYARWQAEAETTLLGGLTRQAEAFARILDGPAAAPAEAFSPQAVIAQALEACHGDDGKATFTRHDLVRQLDLALPANLGSLPAGEAAALLDHLADTALGQADVVQVAGREIGHAPASGRLASGLAATIDPASVQYATRGHLAAEMALLRSAGVRGRTAVARAEIEAWLDGPGASLSAAQRAAVVGLASSDAAMAVLVGPAGTGKSYTAGMFDAAWRDLTGGRVVGVTTTQVAADVLADDGVTDTSNIAAFLAAQNRLAAGHGSLDDQRWRLTANDVLVVDEASMVDTGSLSRLQAAVEGAGARLVLMGDPHQLGAVGAGGMMRAAIDRDAETYTLADVRRFTAEWERDASLQLRDGDDTAVDDYDRHGRLVDAGTEPATIAAVARAAAADLISGRETVVVTGSNEHAALVSAAIRRHLVDAGLVDEGSTVLGRDSTAAGVGDVVQARRIDRGLGLVNRETYRVESVREDGALEVVSTRTGLTWVMPAEYVAADVTLAYASTAHGAQGRTVDVGHVLLSRLLDRAGAYVGLTRGRDRNTAWAVTDTGDPEQPLHTARGLLSAALIRTDLLPDDAAAVDVDAADEAHRTNAGTLLGLIEDESRIACRQRLDADLDQLVADGVLDAELRARFGAEQGSEHLARLLRSYEQAGHDPADVLRSAIEDRRGLTDSVSVSQVIAHRIDPGGTIPTPAAGIAAPARVADDRAGYFTELADLLGDRQRDLGSQVADGLPTWAVTAIGSLPEDPVARVEWETRAGIVAAQREASGWDHPDVPLGRCPGVHTPERRAAWHAAYAAAGMPEDRRAEAEMTVGRLLVRVRAAERTREAAPAAVHDAQRERNLAAEAARQEAVLARSRGLVEEADQLEADAAEHAAAADRLDAIARSRAESLIANAETQSVADAARAELITRGRAPGAEEDRTTAADYLAWLAAEDEARVADDPHRTITEDDLHDAERTADRSVALTEDDGAQHMPELASIRERPARPAEQLSASAVAAEIDAAAVHAAFVVDELADQASQNETAPVDDDWARTRTDEHEAGTGRDDATADTSWTADDASSAGWDDAAEVNR